MFNIVLWPNFTGWPYLQEFGPSTMEKLATQGSIKCGRSATYEAAVESVINPYKYVIPFKLLGEVVVHDLTVWALMAYVEFVFKVHVPASRHLHCVKQMRSSCILSFIKISKPLGSWFVNCKNYKSHPGS